MIEVKNIFKAFGEKVIIDDVSATFKPGICNLIIGASGSGKTVLTKCMVDLIQAVFQSFSVAKVIVPYCPTELLVPAGEFK